MAPRLLVVSVAALVLSGCGAGGPMEADAQAPGAGARADLYACEGCEAVAERDPAGLAWSTRMAGPEEPGTPMRIEGTVFQVDGRTPAPGVVVYAHHTNSAGLYADGSAESEWSRRHGRLRGWVRTGADGRYRFDTIKPGLYPDRSEAAHVHLTVQEPGRRPYWIDEIVFRGDPGVTDAYIARQDPQGGGGVVTLERGADGGLVARRDIRLERHPG